MLVMWKLNFCDKLSIASPSYHVRKMKKGGAWFSPYKTFGNYILNMQRNFRFLILGCKKCSEGNFVTSAKDS